jgi:hypothetical protein
MMAMSLSRERRGESGEIERHYRLVGWWGGSLALFGLVVLLVALTVLSFE